MTADCAALVVPRRFNGPAGSAHGGYLCGRLASMSAAQHGPNAVVTLLEPPPLETPLRFERGTPRSRLTVGDRLLAMVATAGPPVVEPPAFVTPEAAERASAGFAGRGRHPFPTCFACGPRRDEGDGLRLAPGRLESVPDTVACRWIPHPGLGRGGVVPAEIVWAALDCPGGWITDPAANPMLLNRMSAVVDRLPAVGTPYVIVSTLRERNGRVLRNAGALYDTTGELLARATASWVVLAASTDEREGREE
ncbi:hypothetical protein AB0M54_18700 [Actinoplanes sp. NPDC051470]|uniref:hypothetical protein n=1 Tax=unclassified Actinoplanes TaxID=2626549 RepID=UPI003448C9AC